MSTEIKLIQNPIIQHKLAEVGKSVTERIAGLNIDNLVATEDTVKSLKTLRIELNKEFEEYEAQRKAIKEAVSNPYLEFDAIYKVEISEKYKKAVEIIKDKIAIVEDKIKATKKANVMRYFSELCTVEKIDFLKFEDVGLEINLSTTEKAYKEKCNEFVQRVADDVLLINVQENPAEIFVEYKKTLNASKAITAVSERKASEKLQAERIKQAETNRRQTLLRSLAMVLHEMTKSFNWVQDVNVFITISDIENLSKDDFQKRFVELETLTKPVIIQPAPVAEVAKTVQNAPAPTLSFAAEPISAPTVAAHVEKLVSASFEVTGTMSQLIDLKAYLIENKLTYTNI
jgi:hypothetical protein